MDAGKGAKIGRTGQEARRRRKNSAMPRALRFLRRSNVNAESIDCNHHTSFSMAANCPDIAAGPPLAITRPAAPRR